MLSGNNLKKHGKKPNAHGSICEKTTARPHEGMQTHQDVHARGGIDVIKSHDEIITVNDAWV